MHAYEAHVLLQVGFARDINTPKNIATIQPTSNSHRGSFMWDVYPSLCQHNNITTHFLSIYSLDLYSFALLTHFFPMSFAEHLLHQSQPISLFLKIVRMNQCFIIRYIYTKNPLHINL